MQHQTTGLLALALLLTACSSDSNGRPESILFRAGNGLLEVTLDADITLWDGRTLRVDDQGTAVVLQSTGSGRLVWEIDLTAWNRAGTTPSVWIGENALAVVDAPQLDTCARCIHADGDRWLYVALNGDAMVTLIP